MVITREYEQRRFGDVNQGSIICNGYDYFIVTNDRDRTKETGVALRLDDGRLIEFPFSKNVYVLNKDQYTFTVRG
jgi:hypothetical protein